ncbi:uncharacterized protein LOC144107185 [Amblyomma americanum]
METLLSLLAAFGVLQVTCVNGSSGYAVSRGPCAKDEHVDWTQSIESQIRKIPNNITLPRFFDIDTILDAKISAPTLTGLGSMRVNLQYRAACVDGSTYLFADVVNEDPLVVSMDWTMCSGPSGTLGTKVSSLKLRLGFKAHPTSGDPTRIKMAKMFPRDLQDVDIFVSGASDGVTSAVKGANVLLNPYARKLWNWVLNNGAQLMPKQ